MIRPSPISNFGWLYAKCGLSPLADMQAIEAVDGKGRILGMVGFCDWKPNSVQLHFALAAPTAIRSLAPVASQLVFERFGRNVALATVSENNRKSARLVEWLGFREFFRIPEGWGRGVDLLLFEMRREGCRFLSRKAA